VLVTVVTNVSDILVVPETFEIKATHTRCNNSQTGITLGQNAGIFYIKW